MINRTFIIATAFAALVAIAGGFALGRSYTGRADRLQEYIARRGMILELQSRHARSGMTLLVGDSISERAVFEELCGRPVFNAGISTARLQDVAPLARRLARAIRPAQIVLAVGENDANARYLTDEQAWRRDYATLLHDLEGYPIEVVGILRPEAGKSVSANYNAAWIARSNARLKRIAAASGASFAPVGSVATEDGVHPSRAGYAAWRSAIDAGCTAKPGGKRASRTI